MAIINEKPKISVIMLTYNRENLLQRAVKSMLNQVFLNFELIIINNGSTDKSAKIADTFSKMDSRIQTVHRKKGSIGSARNAGIELSQGKYITFFDDDDFAAPDYLEFLYNLAEDSVADIAVCGSYLVEHGKTIQNGFCSYNEKYILSGEQALENLLLKKLFDSKMPTKLIRRSLFNNLSFPSDENFGEITTLTRLFEKSLRVCACGKPKYTFYRHSDCAVFYENCDSLKAKQINEHIASYRKRTEFIKDSVPKFEKASEWSEWSYMLSVLDKIKTTSSENLDDVEEYIKTVLSRHKTEFINSSYSNDLEKTLLNKYL